MVRVDTIVFCVNAFVVVLVIIFSSIVVFIIVFIVILICIITLIRVGIAGPIGSPLDCLGPGLGEQATMCPGLGD